MFLLCILYLFRPSHGQLMVPTNTNSCAGWVGLTSYRIPTHVWCLRPTGPTNVDRSVRGRGGHSPLTIFVERPLFSIIYPDPHVCLCVLITLTTPLPNDHTAFIYSSLKLNIKRRYLIFLSKQLGPFIINLIQNNLFSLIKHTSYIFFD
jgi:hypothetical protein